MAKNSLRDLCFDSLGDFYLAMNPGYEYVPYQQEIIVPALEGLEAGDFDRLMIFMPSRHAKSDIGTKAFIPWFLGKNARKNVILFSHTQDLANDFGSHIRDTMTRSDQFRLIFPNVKVDNASKAKDFFKTNQGNSFYAFGINASAPGRGGDLIVIDDPIGSMEDGQSELIQHNLFEAYKAVIKQRMQANGRICLFMTRWAPRDIAARILEEEGKHWKVVVLQAQSPDPENCEGCADNTPHECQAKYLWEEHRGRLYYEEAKKDAYIWEAMWQQTPAPRLSQGFQESWLRFYVTKNDHDGNPLGRTTEYREDGSILSEPMDFALLRRFNTYIMVDPAVGKEAAHDRTCILVLAAGPQGRFFLVDAVLDRLDPGERISHIIRLARNWKVQQVLVEEYGLATDSYFLKEKMALEGITDLMVIPVGRKGIKGLNGGRLGKSERIMQLVPDFQGGRIWLPKRMLRTLEDGTKFDIIQNFIAREYLPWAGEGSTAHDDMLDCLSRIRDPEFFPIFQTRDDENENYDNYADSSGGSWESRY